MTVELPAIWLVAGAVVLLLAALVAIIWLVMRLRASRRELGELHRASTRRESASNNATAEAEGVAAVVAADVEAEEEVAREASTGNLGSHLSDLNRRSGSTD